MPDAERMDWSAWSGQQAMRTMARERVEYWRLAVKFLWRGVAVPVADS